MRNNAPTAKNKHKLRNIGLLAGICEENCDFCVCRNVVADVLRARDIRPEEVLALDNMPPDLKEHIQRTKARVGEYVVENEDYLDIDTYRPIPDSILAVSDDEL